MGDIDDLLLLYAVRRRRIRRHDRRWQVKELLKKRKEYGHFNNLVADMRLYDEDAHFNYFRMTRAQMDHLLSLVGSKLEPIKTNWRKDTISAAERLSITVRFLATGDSYKSMGFAYNCSPSSICVIVKQTTKVIWEILGPLFVKNPTTNMWFDIATHFERRWNFPHCCGAIDGKHIEIKCPPNSGSAFINYKGFFSITLLAVADAAYTFSFVDVSGYGRQSDGGTFKESQIGDSILKNQTNFPKPSLLPNSQFIFPYVLVGDEAFPLTENLMRPYPGTGLSYEKLIYNYRLKRARLVVENTFGILASRWRLYHRVVEMMPDTVDNVVLATIGLHNFLRCQLMGHEDRYCPKGYTDSWDNEGNFCPGKWRESFPRTCIIKEKGHIGKNNYKNDAAVQRDTLANYFTSKEGEVPFQHKAVKKYLSSTYV